MSFRVLACFLFVLGFSFYAWRNWFISLCALVLLTAVLEHPDMPKTIAGIQGLNPWNLLMGNVFLGWAIDRRTRARTALVPRAVLWAFLAYAAVILSSSLRLMLDPKEFSASGLSFLLSEYFVNTYKWLLPGYLFFTGCHNRGRAEAALAATAMLYLLLAIQVIRWIPLRYAVASGTDLSYMASRMITNEIGYNRVTLSMMLGGGSWALFCLHPLLERRSLQFIVIVLAGIVLLGQALTGGRSGYLAWGIVGSLLCAMRWRRALLLLPVLAMGALALLPGVRDRMLQGFGGREGNIVHADDDYEITSGRTLAWPFVIDKIREHPVFGSGREAMSRTGLKQRIFDEYPGEAFPHPHNAYLEALLDYGTVGFAAVMGLFLLLLSTSIRLFRSPGDTLFCAAGGASCALLLALFVASFGGQTFYAREGSVGMWAAVGIMLRVSVERQRALTLGLPLFAGYDATDEPPSKWGPRFSELGPDSPRATPYLSIPFRDWRGESS